MSNREERRRYENEVWYEVWRAGGNPDRINDDRVDDYYWEGRSSDAAARAELDRMRTPHNPEHADDED